MGKLYHDILDDEDRKVIDFLLINGSDGIDYADNLKTQKLRMIQDDPTDKIFESISNNDPRPKDDMAFIDKHGRLIAYYESANSSMYNYKKNNIRTKVEEMVSPDYENPCGEYTPGTPKKEKKNKEKKNKKEKKSNKQKENSTVEYEKLENLEALMGKCAEEKGMCKECRGRYDKKLGTCQLKTKMMCKHLRTKRMCLHAGCKYKKAKERCRSQIGSVFDPAK